MNYLDTLQAINPVSAMKSLGIETTISGAYLHFACKCEKQAVIKAYGEKKNLIFCPSCKSSGHIIKLVMEKKALDWEGAKSFLKDCMPTDKVIETKLSFEYDLQYTNQLEAKGLTKDFCKRMGIGRPQGKTMLAGTIAFIILNKDRDPIAYYGLRIKDSKPVFHKSFNPELYLYGYNDIDKEQEVYFTTDIWKCLEIIQKGGQAVCNFGLPYLSASHTEMLQQIKTVLYVKDQYSKDIQKQVMQMTNYFKFVE
jgi:hypothetical protein